MTNIRTVKLTTKCITSILNFNINANYLTIFALSTGNLRQEYHQESSPKHTKTEEHESHTEAVAESPTSRYIHFNLDSPSSLFKETDI